MVETRLRSNSNNRELQEAGNACWVLHSNRLTDSNDSRIFLRESIKGYCENLPCLVNSIKLKLHEIFDKKKRIEKANGTKEHILQLLASKIRAILMSL